MQPKNIEGLLKRYKDLQMRLEVAEETLRAIRNGEVDAVVARGPDGDAVYTLKGADEGYRLLVEQMAEGAMSLTTSGLILFANDQLAAMLGLPLERVIGSRIQAFVAPEGRSVPLSTLAAIHAKLPAALIDRAVDRRLKPYFDVLRSRALPDSIMAGFKFIREAEAEPDHSQDEEEVELPEGEPEAPEEPEEEKQPLFFWFFFPMRDGKTAAWEASTGSGRATYFFRLAPPEDAAQTIQCLTRGLALVNFRREPVYLSDDALERQPRFRRYAIGCRKLPDLRALRASMLGRALHSSLEAWQAQLDAPARR
jgi:PAS domain-containing protein